jgi:hypothetical protein
MLDNQQRPNFPWPQTPVFKTNQNEWPVRNLIPQKQGMLGLPQQGGLLAGLPDDYFMMMAGDGVSNQTKRKLMELGIFDRRDFQPAPQPQMPQAPGGDPTRRVTQQQYQQMLQEQQRRQQEAYIRYRQR